MLDRLIFLQYVEHPYRSIATRRWSIVRRRLSSPWQSIFQHILEIPLRQSGRRILRDPPLASARYLVTIPLVTPPIIAGSSRRV